MSSTSKCKFNKTDGKNTNLLLLTALFVFVTGVSHAEGFGDILLKEVVKEIQSQSQRVQNSATSSSSNQQVQVSPPVNNNRVGTASSLYSGEARWGVGTGIIYDSSADASMTVALKVLANTKASSKITAKEYFASMVNTIDTKGEFRPRDFSFLDGSGVEVKPKLLDCLYKEKLDSKFQKPYQDKVIRVGIWNKGTRILLHPTMQRNFDQYRERLIDVEMETCPANLALAFEAGLGANVWNDIEPKFQENFSTNLQSNKEYLINMKKNGGKEKTNQSW